MSEPWFEKIEKLAAEVAKNEGCLLYDIEFTGAGKGRTLCIYIDKEDGGVGVDDCARVSNALNPLLDEQEDLVPGGMYNLEVSTPGVDRHLRLPWHFSRVVGKKVYIKTSKALESAGVEDKKWKAAKTIEEVLVGADDKCIHFKVKGVELNVPYEMIEKAKLVFEFNKGKKK